MSNTIEMLQERLGLLERAVFQLSIKNEAQDKKIEKLQEDLDQVYLTSVSSLPDSAVKIFKFMDEQVVKEYQLDDAKVLYRSSTTLGRSRRVPKHSDEKIARDVLYYLVNRVAKIPIHQIQEHYGYKTSHYKMVVESNMNTNKIEKEIVDRLESKLRTFVISIRPGQDAEA